VPGALSYIAGNVGMEQQIRYCTTSDGVRIAYAVTGSGPPVVRVAGWFTHLESEMTMEAAYALRVLAPLVEDFTVIRYDGRGMGLSQRDVTDFSLDSKMRDLEAVVDAMGLEEVFLFAASEGGAVAVAFAVRHPEKTKRMVLWDSFARAPMADDPEAARAMLSMIKVGWGLDIPAYRQFFTSLFIPDGNSKHVAEFTEAMRASSSPDNALTFAMHLGGIDVKHLLPEVRVPTLVMHRRGDIVVPFEAGQELAMRIPNARFMSLEGRNHIILRDEPEVAATFRAAKDFFLEGERPAAAVLGQSGLVSILFTDMAGSTDLTQRVGDETAQEAVRRHNSVVRKALKAHSGTEIKHTGDGIMASFASGRRAVDCAIEIQREFAADDNVRVRIGLNAGEPVEEERDLYGTSVQLAARVCAKAEPGQILVSNVVRELTMGKGFLFSDVGDVALKGFEDPVRLYEVRWKV
jgi:class 3 adenylate cyclase